MRFKDAIKNLNHKGQISVEEIVEMIDREGLVFYQEKYGFIRILTGYDLRARTFRYVQAPLAYSTNKWSTIIHLYTLKMCTEHSKSFDELQYFSWKIEPFNKFIKWILMNVYGLKHLTTNKP